MQHLIDATITLKIIINDAKAAMPKAVVELTNPNGKKLQDFAEGLNYNNKYKLLYINMPIWEAEAIKQGIKYEFKVLCSKLNWRYYALKFANKFYNREYERLGAYGYQQLYGIEVINND